MTIPFAWDENGRDPAIAGSLNAIRERIRPPQTGKRPIGFVMPEGKKRDKIKCMH